MRLIIGLGNPGNEYENTRHNAGFLAVEALQKLKLPKDVVVKKSDTFMNDSGKFVLSQYTKYHIPYTNLFVVHDDLDIKLGEYKVQLGHGPKDHNGTKSVDDSLDTDEYWHVKIGIDNRPFDGRPMGIEYVLQNFTDDERQILNNVIKEVCNKLVLDLQK